MPRRTIKQVEAEYQARHDALLQENGVLSERLAALELALETMDWRRLTAEADQEFSRDGLRIIVELARIMAIKNPVVKRGVEVKQLYVWGQGWSVKAGDPDIDEALQAFLADTRNQPELSHQARKRQERELQTDGNLFFCFFPNAVTGRVRVRTINFDEMATVICNPEDRKEPWYYRRQWHQETTDLATGATAQQQMTAYYPDWRYNPVAKPPAIGDVVIHWDKPVLHIAADGYGGGVFGVSEIYAAIDWSRAYKEFLEDWASIVRAYRRFAFQMGTSGGKQGVAAAKAKLATTYGNAGTGAETNPAPTVGATFVTDGNVNLQPVRTSGATVAAEDGRRLLLMVAASFGLAETFFGDVSVGTLATATSLDRPTELMMRDRQTLWSDIYMAIFDYVLLWAVKAPQGALRNLGRVETVLEEGCRVETVVWNADVGIHIDIDFPPVLGSDVLERVQAIVAGATLDGKSPAGTLDPVTVTRLLLVALGEDDVDEIIEALFPAGVAEWPAPDAVTPTEAALVEAARELRSALVRLRENQEE